MQRLMKQMLDLPVTCYLAAAAVACFWLPGVADSWQFDRSLVAGGQWWRVLSGHLAHWNGEHLFWDLATFTALGLGCERIARGRYFACLLLSAVAIPASIVWLQPQISVYRGLSGIDTAIFSLLAAVLLRQMIAERQWQWVAGIAALLAGLMAKTGFELVTGSTLFVDSATAFVPLPLAHIIGAAVGMSVGLLPLVLFTPSASREIRPDPCRAPRCWPVFSRR